MRVLDKHVQMDENYKPVLLVTLELPLSLDRGFVMKGGDFLAAFYDALQNYEDAQKEKLND